MRTLAVWFVCLFLFASPVKAVRSLTITSDKTQLSNNEEMLITASVSGFATDEAVFVKGAFFQEGSTNYFGLTKNGDSWIKNAENYANQLRVELSSWDKTVRIRNDPNDSGFKGNGDYKFKLGFYYTNASGTESSVNWAENILTVKLSVPDPTPTATPTPTAVATSTPTKTPAVTPTATAKTSLALPVKTSSPTTYPVASQFVETLDVQGSILGVKDENKPAVVNTPQTGVSVQNHNPPPLAFFLIGAGLIFIGSSVYFFIKTPESSLNQNDI